MLKRIMLTVASSILPLVLFGCATAITDSPQTGNTVKIEGTGAYYVASGAAGRISGKDYYFTILNAEGSEPGISAAILVLDISNPFEPVRIAYLKAPQAARFLADVELYNTTLLVSASDFLWIIDVSDPSNPKEISKLPSVRAMDAAAEGDLVYVNDGNDRIVAVDISEPAKPQIVSELSMPSKSGIVLTVSGSVLYVVAEHILNIIDVSSPDSLNVLGTFGHRYIANIQVEGKYGYLAFYGDDAGGMLVLDISNPSAPEEIAVLELPDVFTSWLYFSHGKMYISSSKYGTPGTPEGIELRRVFHEIDVSKPDSPEEISSFTLPVIKGSSIMSFDIVGSYLYWFIGTYPKPPRIEIIKME